MKRYASRPSKPYPILTSTAAKQEAVKKALSEWHVMPATYVEQPVDPRIAAARARRKGGSANAARTAAARAAVEAAIHAAVPDYIKRERSTPTAKRFAIFLVNHKGMKDTERMKRVAGRLLKAHRHGL